MTLSDFSTQMILESDGSHRDRIKWPDFFHELICVPTTAELWIGRAHSMREQANPGMPGRGEIRGTARLLSLLAAARSWWWITATVGGGYSLFLRIMI
ncbi:hypothetical protein J2T08_002956 [Neorhizobium galegae]|uniref:hypothetical protein n=1 Tax=Neorhizobium galegae TaxID=399 RepID=UPI002788284F|nr:hypothetical protein [Neorhizobium galegae]MDQ0135035.1 hypothetical protein [Neorhizobium galegae]